MWATKNNTNDLKINNVYAKYTIEKFWEWWSDKEDVWMEVRIRDINIIRQLGDKYKFHWNASGVYVNNAADLRRVIAFARDKTVLWFGINPRIRNHTKRGLRFGGGDAFIQQLKYIFIDIDRTIKTGEATNEDLNNATLMADEILNKLNEHEWNKNYCKICSGNGVQLMLKLDVPITLPILIFDSKTESFIDNAEFDKIKNIIKQGIGKDITKFCSQFKKDYNAEIDVSCFRISGVGALPFTKNFKYGGFTWRGIIELKEEQNVGLTDYIMSKELDLKQYRKNNLFKIPKASGPDLLVPGKLKQNRLIQFMMNNEFPEGYINNTLWFQLKILLRDSHIDLSSEEFKELYRELKHKHKRSFSLNLPTPNYNFDKRVINNYCITHLIPPVFNMFEIKNKKLDFGIQDLDTERIIRINIEPYYLPTDTILLEDLATIKKQFIEKEYFKNNELYLKFLKGIIYKYNIKTANYINENLQQYFIYGD